MHNKYSVPARYPYETHPATANSAIMAQTLIDIRDALETYAECHSAMYSDASGPGTSIGQDYVLGPHWLAIAAGLVGLLNGECGPIDCGDFDRAVRSMARENGFSENEADTLESEHWSAVDGAP